MLKSAAIFSHRSGTPHNKPYKAFITQESYEKHSCLPTFAEYFDQAIQLGLQDHTAQQASGNGSSSTGAVSGVPYSDFSLAPVSYGAFSSTASSEIQFPCVSRLSVEDQKLFMDEYAKFLSGEMNKLEFKEMKTVQVSRMGKCFKNILQIKKKKFFFYIFILFLFFTAVHFECSG